jgi:hypothetical protein
VQTTRINAEVISAFTSFADGKKRTSVVFIPTNAKYEMSVVAEINELAMPTAGALKRWAMTIQNVNPSEA